MFERFTDRARRVVVLAQEEARLLDHSYIGTEHLLLGMIHEGDGLAAHALAACGVGLEPTRAEVLGIVGRGTSTPTGHIPFTVWAKKTLEQALREALDLDHSYIGTEHLLLGLLDTGDRVGRKVLDGLRVPPADLRAKVLELIGLEAPPATPPGGGRHVQIVPGRRRTGAPLDQVVRAVRDLLGRDPEVVPRRDQASTRESDAGASRLRRKGSRVDAIVFVLSGEDVGAPRTAEPPDPASLQPRAGQDTIYQLGWFHGLLGRERVIVLVEEDVEPPAGVDVQAIVLDAAGAWRPALRDALDAAGIALDPGASA